MLLTVSGKIDLRTMKRKRSKRKAVREDRLMLLSPRESQVVELMGKGWSRAEISDRLGVSRKCVSVFIERAREENLASKRRFNSDI
jgi:DNA-binding NarL/FixJ family response regulator